jgi:hypothetical protein
MSYLVPFYFQVNDYKQGLEKQLHILQERLANYNTILADFIASDTLTDKMKLRIEYHQRDIKSLTKTINTYKRELSRVNKMSLLQEKLLNLFTA